MWLKFVPIGVVLQFLEPYAFEMKPIDQTADWILFGTLTVIFSANGFYAWFAARSNPAAMFSRITGNERA
jgi:hypothetical protein